MKNRLRSKLQRGFDAVRGAIPVAEEADSDTVPPVYTLTLLTDSYGFPLSIFTKVSPIFFVKMNVQGNIILISASAIWI